MNRKLAGYSFLMTVLGLAALSTSIANAADWGTIKGKFVYKGDPKTAPLNINKDVEFCGEHKPVDETIVVGDGGALRDVFVYLYVARGKKVEIHPDYKPGELKSISNKGCRFEPHSLVLWTADELEVRNDDTIGHNTNINFVANSDFNQLVANGSPLKKKLEKREDWPSPVACNIHPWMKANLLVRDNPYMAATGEDGSFEIENVPAGKQEIVLWHEAKGYLRDLKVGKEKADRKGQIEVTVPAGGEVDLGVIEVTPANLGQ
jgi:hypothetical protein